MRAPIPYFGKKDRAAPIIWRALGDVPRYVAPFCGSLSVELARPTPPGREVFNDVDGFVVNFLRALRGDAISVWKWSHDPPTELDKHARHVVLKEAHGLTKKLRKDPEYFDARIAGWWAWGLSMTIAGTAMWCNPDRPIYLAVPLAVPRGIHNATLDDLIWLGRRFSRSLITCGDWKRVLTNSYTTHAAPLTGVLLDPPYSVGDDGLYASHDKGIAAQVRDWALEHGDDKRLRIILCGYEGEHALPKRWRKVAWTTKGGYAHNGQRERLWLSPHCLK